MDDFRQLCRISGGGGEATTGNSPRLWKTAIRQVFLIFESTGTILIYVGFIFFFTYQQYFLAFFLSFLICYNIFFFVVVLFFLFSLSHTILGEWMYSRDRDEFQFLSFLDAV